MKKLKILLAFILYISLLSSLHSQIVVSYDYKNFNTVCQTILTVNDSISLFKYDQNDKELIENEILRDYYLFKNLQTKNILEATFVLSKLVYVKDSLDLMKWKPNNETKNILGQKCLSATTTFRGRAYTAYYATLLPYSNGPWKFGGLPGLILEVFSDDNGYYFKATNIVQNSKEQVNTKDIYKHTYITWQEYAKIFITKMDNLIKNMSTTGELEFGQETILKIDFIEIIYPKVQLGKGAKF
jgi:GLPGLI family protein